MPGSSVGHSILHACDMHAWLYVKGEGRGTATAAACSNLELMHADLLQNGTQAAMNGACGQFN
jgi:hypothetical protein